MSRRLHIASVCRSLPTPTDPSSGIFVLNRVTAMALGAEVELVQPVPHFPLLAPLPAWAKSTTRVASGLRIEHAPMFYFPRVFKSLDATWLRRAVADRIERMHRDRPIDVIDAHFGYPEGAGCVAVARGLGIPLFITIRGFEKEFVTRRLIGRQMLDAFAAATGIVAVSHSLRELAVRHGVDPAKIRVIHNAIDRQVFRVGNRAEARRALGLEPELPLIVSVGHLISRKRHHVLIEAFGRARARVADARLVIVGAPSFEARYPDELRAQASALGIANEVRFVGNLPPAAVVEWLRAADVFALASAREGCCNAVLEALGTGRPVVTTPVGDNRFFVRNGENGFLVPVDDAVALSEALVGALSASNWDEAGIAAGLEVGNWSDVGRLVLDFMSERLDATGGAAMVRHCVA